MYPPFIIVHIANATLYRQETIGGESEFGDDAKSSFSMMSGYDRNTLGDISPDAL